MNMKSEMTREQACHMDHPIECFMPLEQNNEAQATPHYAIADDSEAIRLIHSTFSAWERKLMTDFIVEKLDLRNFTNPHYLCLPTTFLTYPVEEKYKCTYYKQGKDGRFKPVKTVITTKLVYSDDDEARPTEEGPSPQITGQSEPTPLPDQNGVENKVIAGDKPLPKPHAPSSEVWQRLWAPRPKPRDDCCEPPRPKVAPAPKTPVQVTKQIPATKTEPQPPSPKELLSDVQPPAQFTAKAEKVSAGLASKLESPAPPVSSAGQPDSSTNSKQSTKTEVSEPGPSGASKKAPDVNSKPPIPAPAGPLEGAVAPKELKDPPGESKVHPVGLKAPLDNEAAVKAPTRTTPSPIEPKNAPVSRPNNEKSPQLLPAPSKQSPLDKPQPLTTKKLLPTASKPSPSPPPAFKQPPLALTPKPTPAAEPKKHLPSAPNPTPTSAESKKDPSPAVKTVKKVNTTESETSKQASKSPSPKLPKPSPSAASTPKAATSNTNQTSSTKAPTMVSKPDGPTLERKPPQLNLDSHLKTSPSPPPKAPNKTVLSAPTPPQQDNANRIETEFFRIKSSRLPLVCLFGLSHPAILKQKNDLLYTIARHFNFALLDPDKIIGEWRERPRILPKDLPKEPPLPELVHQQAHIMLRNSKNYKENHYLTALEICQLLKHALVAFQKIGKRQCKGYVLDSFPINPTESELLQGIIYPMAVGIYMHPTHQEKEVKYPENFRRNIEYSEQVCREIAMKQGNKLVEILHPSQLNHTKVTRDLIPLISHILGEYRKGASATSAETV